MDDVAKELGVSKGALYSYITSKEDLLREISLQGHQTLRTLLSEMGACNNLEEALERVYMMITEKEKGNLHRQFEIVALASHDEKIRKIVFEDCLKDVEAVEVFIDEKKKQGVMRTDVDDRVLAELFTALRMGTLAKLLIGYQNKEVHDYWVKSMMLILCKTKTQNAPRPNYK